MIKVSVIIPVYNAEKYLCQCLDSVLNQTIKEIEIICVDDGSTDASLQILNKYAQQDNRITVLTQRNKGAGAARNAGMKIARGAYLSFLDSDDFFSKDMLMACYQKMEADGADVVVFAAKRFDDKTKRISEMPWSLSLSHLPGKDTFHPQEMAGYLFNSFQNWPWNKMFRRTFIEENAITFQESKRTNDMAFVVMALALASKISIIRSSFVFYRNNSGNSLQQTNDKAPLSFWEAYKETKKRLENYDLYSQYEQSFMNTILNGAFYNLRSLNTFNAYKELYEKMRNEAETDFSFQSHPESYYYQPSLYRELIKIETHSLEEYLFAKLQYCGQRQRPVQRTTFLEKIKKVKEFYQIYGFFATAKKIISVLIKKIIVA